MSEKVVTGQLLRFENDGGDIVEGRAASEHNIGGPNNYVIVITDPNGLAVETVLVRRDRLHLPGHGDCWCGDCATCYDADSWLYRNPEWKPPPP